MPEPPKWGQRQVDPFPTAIVLVGGSTMLYSAKDGSVTGVGREGLYDCDTRVVSRHQLTLNGHALDVVGSALLDPSRWTGTLRSLRKGGTPEGPLLPQSSFELTIVRRVGLGLLEELELVNHGMTAGAVDLVLALDGDFVEVVDLESARTQRGTTQRRWLAAAHAWQVDHHDEHEGRHLHRAMRVRVLAADGACPLAIEGSEHGLRAHGELPPRGRARLRLSYEHFIDGRWRSPTALGDDALEETERDRARAQYHQRRAHVAAPGNVVMDAFEGAADDLFSLRLWERDPPSSNAWIPSAGAPLYSGVFGRDVLTTGWQASLATTDVARAAVHVCAQTQGTRDAPFFDEEPGRMIHEMRQGPLSELGVIPQARYYGSQTTPAMFIVALTELWHWTGDIELLREHEGTVLRTLAWAERFGDLDGDGLLEYRRRTTFGPKNQGWKDSDEAIRWPDGGQVPNPIATIEENAFHCIALQRAAELFTALGDDGRADELMAKAAAMKRRWHDAFWMPAERAYAMALDPDKRQVASIGSNVGHALGAGIVPGEHAKDVVDRLLAPDMFSGWGVRTLSSAHPSFDPLAYHLGTVWPVENATFALGCKRYGFDDAVERIVTAQLEAASYFRACRLPEAISGHARAERPVPIVYPGSCSPQAWSASATLQLVQTMLGIYAYAPLHVLALVRPRLPAWLPTLIVRDLRVGDARVTLRFERDRHGAAHHDVLERHGTVHIVPAAPPNDTGEASLVEAVQAFALDHAPGRRLRALRVALGSPRATSRQEGADVAIP